MHQIQKGFSIILVIIMVLVVAALAFAGWRIYEASQERSDQQAGANTSAPGQAGQDNGDIQEPKVLEIKELGIRITLSDSVSDITYKTQLDDEQYPKVFLSTQALTEAANECSADGIAPPLGAIMVTKNSTDEFGIPLAANDNNIIKIEDTFVVLRNPQSPCSTDQQIESMATRKRQVFAEDFKTVKLVE